MNILKDYVKHVREKTDANILYLLLSGFWLVSSSLGPLCYLYYPSSVIRPNIYICLVGKPSVSRKTTVIRYATSAYRNFMQEIGDDKRDILELFTIEGACDYIEDKKLSIVSIASEEFGIALEKAKTNKHMMGLPVFLCKLYDGSSYSQHLASGKSRVIKAGIYTTMLVGVQSAEQFSQSMYQQGLIRRIMFAKDNPHRKKKPPLTFGYINDFDITPLVDRYNELLDVETFTLHPNVESRINEYYNHITSGADEAVIEYLDSAAHHLLKLTILTSLADTKNKPKDGNLITLPEHLDQTLKVYDVILRHSLSCVKDIILPKREQPHISTQATFNRILDVVEKNGGWIRHGELLTTLGMKISTLSIYLATLKEADKIVLIECTKNKYSRKPRRYVVKKDKLPEFLVEHEDYKVWEVETPWWI